ncbi:dihydroneopterin aldolase [Leucobacter soli]|uniref:dihydroneopterin aldolase n=1 Tax=Leucobacter soli TaxID=2812850 RepID=UPI00361245EE
MRDDLARLAETARAAGISHERLVLDPGLGFDKTTAQGWQLLAGLPRLQELGYPVLVGVSRKRMVLETLASSSVSTAEPLAARGEVTMADRDLATAVVSALSAGVSAWGVRVHAVAPTVRALSIAEAWRTGAEQAGAERSARRARGGAADRITLTGLEVFAHHGVFDFERERGQRFLIDVELSVDLRAAAGGDDLARTVHYGELAEAIVAAVERDPVDLIETVAERVADVALGFAERAMNPAALGFAETAEARVTVHKPDAPIEASFADVSVTVVRTAGDRP